MEIPFVDTLELREPEAMTPEEAECEISRCNAEIRALSQASAPYRSWLSRLDSRLCSLNKQRHTLQTYITVGISKVPSGAHGIAVAKQVTREDLAKLLSNMSPEELATFAFLYETAALAKG